ncbi:hypothetical protein [Dongia sp.]|uniref:hypothetical protein n=1 Tax=Dongia sp. TaxID=1977262 RepID=UPI0037520550
MAVVVYLLIGLFIAWKAYSSYELGRRSDELLATIREGLPVENASVGLFSLTDPIAPDAAYFCVLGGYSTAASVEPLDRAHFPLGGWSAEDMVAEGSVVIVLANNKLEVLQTFELRRHELDGLGYGRCYQRQDEPVLLREDKSGATTWSIRSKKTAT